MSSSLKSLSAMPIPRLVAAATFAGIVFFVLHVFQETLTGGTKPGSAGAGYTGGFSPRQIGELEEKLQEMERLVSKLNQRSVARDEEFTRLQDQLTALKEKHKAMKDAGQVDPSALANVEAANKNVLSFAKQIKELEFQAAHLRRILRDVQLHKRPGERIDWREFTGTHQPDVVESKLINTIDFSRPWFQELEAALCEKNYHRKLWEFVVILRSLEHYLDFSSKQMRGLGLAVGREPLASYFVKKGAKVIVSDMPVATNAPGAAHVGWANTGQHAQSLKESHKECIVPWEQYEARASYLPIDMNHIPEELLDGKLDFVWSCGSIEHVGSLNLSISAFVNTVRAVRPDGGVVVHTTEFSLMPADKNYDVPGLSIWRKHEVNILAERLRKEVGARLIPVNYAIERTSTDDIVVDLPPYGSVPHMKLSIGGSDLEAGHIHTSIVLIAVRDGGK